MGDGGAARVVVDAMGGDLGPGEVARGALAAAREDGARVLLVGREEVLRAELARAGGAGSDVEVAHAPDVIEMTDHPAQAVRARPEASMVVGVRLVKEGRGRAFVSTGNSGAVMAAALFGLGRIPGIERPALATLFPTQRGRCLLIDVGANVEVKPSYLVQFAHLGAVYLERVFGVARPRVALLANGEEETKGTPEIVEAHRLLREGRLNFVGNIEGKDIPTGELADVVVMDGFTGNVAIKLAEGLGGFFKASVRAEARRGPVSILGALLMKGAFGRLARRLDYQEYGGAPLLGVNGVCIIAHGRSTAKAVRSAIRVARQAAESDVVGTIRAGLAATAAAPADSGGAGQ